MKSPSPPSQIKQALQALMDADERGVRLDDVIAYLDAQNPGGQVGIIPTQDPKYGICMGQLVNMDTGVPIPKDEPVFLFRAKDQYAVTGIQAYLDTLIEHENVGIKLSHIGAVQMRVMDFNRFCKDYPERMKVPTTSLRSTPAQFRIAPTHVAAKTYVDGLREGKDLAWDVFKKRDPHTKVTDVALYIHDILLNKLRDEDRAREQSALSAQEG